ncbi:phosphoglycerate mutase [Massilia forsythiae]|uniref:Phosphoglycerate mutase n=1 Tax=Massilia forsythiae TaxID=2728020 RepID=A0A7Z2VUL9_9BURK|nr:histidine phosphatase family protein [Massilia forsythiae]QJD99414.1 phosphoglycerate mutase [Massilia forsythiae]
MKLLCVRHPQPAIAPGHCYGASDVPVAEAELARVHAALAGAGLPGALPVYASPLQRCSLLARRLQPCALRLDARLAEMDFGAWELRPWSGIARVEVDAWAADLLHYRPGGAENVLDVAARVAAFVGDLRTSSYSGAPGGTGGDGPCGEPAGQAQALLLCHAGTIRLLAALATGLPLEQAALQAAATPHRIGYGEIVALDC